MSAKNFFTETEKQKIINAIRNAELLTSGEIKLHVEDNCKGDVIPHAIKVFHKLKLHKTEQRNGVLIYLAIKDRKFAIIADEGINKKVPENFWEEIKNEMQNTFAEKNFLNGLLHGIKKAGEQLQKYFPVSDSDINELKDDISFGNEKS